MSAPAAPNQLWQPDKRTKRAISRGDRLFREWQQRVAEQAEAEQRARRERQ